MSSFIHTPTTFFQISGQTRVLSLCKAPSFLGLPAKCYLLNKSLYSAIIYLLKVTILVFAECLKDDCANCHERLHHTELQSGLAAKEKVDKMSVDKDQVAHLASSPSFNL